MRRAVALCALLAAPAAATERMPDESKPYTRTSATQQQVEMQEFARHATQQQGTTQAPVRAIGSLITYSWTGGQGSSTLCASRCEACSNNFSPVTADCLGDLCLVNQFAQNNCWDGRYSDSSYAVEQGTVTKSDGTSWVGFRVPQRSTAASSFVASGTLVYYRFATKVDHTMYSWSAAEGFTSLGTVAAADITVGSYSATSVTVHGARSEYILVFLPSDTSTTAWPTFASGVQAATVSTAGGVNINIHRFDAPGQTFDGVTDYTRGPGDGQNDYGDHNRYWPFLFADGTEGIVWQDQSAKTVYCTRLAADMASATHTAMLSSTTWELAGAAGHNGVVIYVMFEAGAGQTATTPVSGEITKYDCNTGTQVKKVTLDTSKTQGMNVYDFWAGSMVWNAAKKQVAMILGKKMTQSSDGLNHQHCSAEIWNTETLLHDRRYSQTTSHCWTHSTSVQRNGDYLTVDLGDNYPRGISVIGWSDAAKKSKLVYTFKTKHATSQSSTCSGCNSIYTGISDSTCPTSGTCYYQWSNDNRVYTETGFNGVIETADGNLLVVFISEQDTLDGLDSSKLGTFSSRGTPRQVGFVLVSPCTSSTCDSTVLSPGSQKQGGFYTFGGSWSAQSNKGVNWLTTYPTTMEENASRLKVLRVSSCPDGSTTCSSPTVKNWLVWEVWSSSTYKRTAIMQINDTGHITKAEFASDYGFRMPRGDDPVLRNGKMVIYTGAGPGKEGPGGAASSPPVTTSRLVRIEISEGTSSPTASPSASPQVPPTRSPSVTGAAAPTHSPSAPTAAPLAPTLSPSTPGQTPAPSGAPSQSPTGSPTPVPTGPTGAPTASPQAPTASPATSGPSQGPVTAGPSQSPATAAPSGSPASPSPSASPTASPSASPVVTPPSTPSAPVTLSPALTSVPVVASVLNAAVSTATSTSVAATFTSGSTVTGPTIASLPTVSFGVSSVSSSAASAGSNNLAVTMVITTSVASITADKMAYAQSFTITLAQQLGVNYNQIRGLTFSSGGVVLGRKGRALQSDVQVDYELCATLCTSTTTTDSADDDTYPGWAIGLTISVTVVGLILIGCIVAWTCNLCCSGQKSTEPAAGGPEKAVGDDEAVPRNEPYGDDRA
eukprot:TRINITY_DN25833_c0_g1_i1.p1 TRINITY_DN25833_c0_g1~~TRINITY_DN25833_c0_g1_i1.p1  ORF type:complete len:1113 (+),score=184.01 TRINITY_DN25833_c0_g1_i1:91-3429(+)